MLRLDWNIVFTIINLLILYLILKRVLVGPIIGVMDKRQDMITSRIEDANQKQVEAREVKDQYDRIMEGVREESKGIIEKARAVATSEYNDKVREASSQADRIMKNAEKMIQTQQQQALHDLESEIAGLALTAAKKVIGQECNEAMNQSLYNQFITQVGEADDTDRN